MVRSREIDIFIADCGGTSVPLSRAGSGKRTLTAHLHTHGQTEKTMLSTPFGRKSEHVIHQSTLTIYVEMK